MRCYYCSKAVIFNSNRQVEINDYRNYPTYKVIGNEETWICEECTRKYSKENKEDF